MTSLRIGAAWALLVLSGCTVTLECVDRSDCSTDQVCVANACRASDCATSLDCDVHEYCEPDGYTCESGCSADSDCLAGESCSVGESECVVNECRTSVLDCGLGQVCDPGGGGCLDEPACETCTGTIVGECGTGQCETFVSGESEGSYCILPCLVPGAVDQCPRGLECVDLSGGGDLFCYADCPIFLAELAQAEAESQP